MKECFGKFLDAICNINIGKIYKSHYQEIFKSILIGKYYKSSFIQKEKQVIITHPKHLFCIDFIFIIIPEFQEENGQSFLIKIFGLLKI